ncbi:hypothetical protein TrLO_g4096 [Triparma laevis f. longispina]|uniref:Uncharacterized protein n=1 Tax=Triparma laevis f. longispina TaxID=1714387 RepID=A0A9W7CBI3_9STRA|nr:hypothetical protein TrLO_g4096 [Triparma laevis f. longispina]
MSDYGDDFAEDGVDDNDEPTTTTTAQPLTPSEAAQGIDPASPGVSSAALAKFEAEIKALKKRGVKMEEKGKDKDKRVKALEMELEKHETGEDLGTLLYDTSEKLVEEGQKNVKLSQKFETTKQKLADSKSEVAQFRELLLSGINGGVSDVENYTHVSLSDLLRLRLQEADNMVSEAVASAKSAPSMNSTLPKQLVTASEADNDDQAAADIGGIQKLEAELEEVKKQNGKLNKQCDNMKAKLEQAFEAVERFQNVQSKVVQLSERSRSEKELRARAEGGLRISNKKVEALSDHIEKLMLHLKHEATSKARAFEEKAKANKEVELLRARNSAILKKNNGRERVISELKEGAKILEDQLRLMDEKYMELRTKLDWTRLQSEKTVKKSQDEARSLRTKFALMQGSFSGGTLLDAVEIGPDGGIMEQPSVGSTKKKKKGRGGGSMAQSQSGML